MEGPVIDYGRLIHRRNKEKEGEQVNTEFFQNKKKIEKIRSS